MKNGIINYDINHKCRYQSFFMEITQIFLWFKPIFTSLGMQHYDNFSANSRGMHEEGKGGRSYVKAF